jgi:zinc resistance-associated protein
MLKPVFAGLLAAGLLVAAPALAQRAAQTDGARGGERLSAEDRAALVDARIAALRTGLKLTADQEKDWPAVESALRDLARQRAAHADEWRAAREKQTRRDPIERMRARANLLGERAAGLKRLADAAEPLYRRLDDGQRRRFQALTRQAVGERGRPRR